MKLQKTEVLEIAKLLKKHAITIYIENWLTTPLSMEFLHLWMVMVNNTLVIPEVIESGFKTI